MESFELVGLENGIFSLKSNANNETFHPAIGPNAEANILHVQQQKIVERLQRKSSFVLWDVGLGAGANALAALNAVLKDPLRKPSHKFLMVSFDQTTRPLEFALENSSVLKYPEAHLELLKKLLANGKVELEPGIEWSLYLGDFREEVKRPSLQAPDAIFYDPYSPKQNTEMWSLEHFKNVYSKLDAQKDCLLTNYSASTYVRVTLLLAGFYVGRGVAVDKKLHTTIASNRLEAIQEPLDKDWLLRRLPISHSAAAIRELPYKIAPVSKEDYSRLLSHPQFL